MRGCCHIPRGTTAGLLDAGCWYPGSPASGNAVPASRRRRGHRCLRRLRRRLLLLLLRRRRRRRRLQRWRKGCHHGPFPQQDCLEYARSETHFRRLSFRPRHPPAATRLRELQPQARCSCSREGGLTVRGRQDAADRSSKCERAWLSWSLSQSW